MDHKSPKFLLDQRVTTPLQHTWLAMLVGYDYEIVYKRGTNNGAADALSRLRNSELLNLSLSSVSTELMDRL